MKIQPFTIDTEDTVNIKAELFGRENKTALVINPAIGVKRKLYNGFAMFMAEQGISVVLYNYRGMEDGLGHLPQDVKLNAETWGRMDQNAVVGWVKSEPKPDQVFVLGHSIGGQLLGFAENIGVVDGLIHAASQKGDYRLWPFTNRMKLMLLWHVLIPWMSRGKFFNAKKIGLGSYPWPEAAIDGLLQEFDLKKVKTNKTNTDNQPIDKRIIDPKSIGLKHIGHFGFFKPETKTLWQNTATWIHQLTQH